MQAGQFTSCLVELCYTLYHSLLNNVLLAPLLELRFFGRPGFSQVDVSNLRLAKHLLVLGAPAVRKLSR